jgi:hypothetical protein
MLLDSVLGRPVDVSIYLQYKLFLWFFRGFMFEYPPGLSVMGLSFQFFNAPTGDVSKHFIFFVTYE